MEERIIEEGEKATLRTDPRKKESIQFIFHGDARDGLTKETRRVIRAILTVLEENTNYQDLGTYQKKIVRSTILDSVNNLKRVALLYCNDKGS